MTDMGKSHTAGPWTWTLDGFVTDKGGDDICCFNTEGRSVSEDHANGALIAAAPDMLAALRDLLPLAFLHMREAGAYYEGMRDSPIPAPSDMLARAKHRADRAAERFAAARNAVASAKGATHG